jgi:hypothetical protein
MQSNINGAGRARIRGVLEEQPCAYCGSTAEDNPRTKGHVLQRSLFPETGFESVQRITVRKCMNCKAIWQDAEDVFRSIMVLGAEDDNNHANEKWDGPVNRSFQRKEDSIQRMEAMMQSLAPGQTSGGEELRLFPHEARTYYRIAGPNSPQPTGRVGSKNLSSNSAFDLRKIGHVHLWTSTCRLRRFLQRTVSFTE